LAALLTRGDSGAGGRQAQAGDVDAEARDKAVRSILHRRAGAVLDRDEKAWLADVDPRATDFRRAQQTVFANLAQVEFSSWKYELIGTEYARQALADPSQWRYHPH